MSIDNGVVVLTEGVTATMRFSAMKITEPQRRDPDTGFVSHVIRLSCQVIELNGVAVTTIFDTLSEKLRAQLEPYKDDNNLSSRLFSITMTGRGYMTEYSVQVR